MTDGKHLNDGALAKLPKTVTPQVPKRGDERGASQPADGTLVQIYCGDGWWRLRGSYDMVTGLVAPEVR